MLALLQRPLPTTPTLPVRSRAPSVSLWGSEGSKNFLLCRWETSKGNWAQLLSTFGSILKPGHFLKPYGQSISQFWHQNQDTDPSVVFFKPLWDPVTLEQHWLRYNRFFHTLFKHQWEHDFLQHWAVCLKDLGSHYWSLVTRSLVSRSGYKWRSSVL